MTLKEQFTQDLLAKMEQAKAIDCGTSAKTLQTITAKGGDELARFIFSREGASENFEKLAKAGRLDLSLEAQVVDNKYASLFSDAEVNYCYMLLVDEGYFVI
jgi:hypothetical protein